MSGDQLEHRVRALLGQAAQVFRGNPRAETWLRRHTERLDEPLRVALTGPPGAGRSTLVNAIIGEDVAPARPDGVPVWFHDGPHPVARVFGETGPPTVTLLDRSARGGHSVVPAGRGGHSVMPAVRGSHSVVPAVAGARDGHTVVPAVPGTRAIVVEWPCRALRHTRLLEAAGDEAHTEADAVLHLVRHLGDDDLAPVPDDRIGRSGVAWPVHMMVVLARADEMSGGRADALATAKRIARRRRRDPHVAAVCQDVLAVSGRIGYAGRTLRQDEFAAIAAIAALPRAEADALLLSADRFAGAAAFASASGPGAVPAGGSAGASALVSAGGRSFGSPGAASLASVGDTASVPAGERGALLDRLGLGGVRLAVTLTRTGARTRAELGEQLVRHSGLSELQSSISDLLTARRTTLKARTALLALEQLLRAEDRPAAGYLIAELERLVATAHEFRELRLIAALRTGRVSLPAELAVEARRLIGGDGDAHSERLGVDPDTPAEHLWPAAEQAAARWHDQTTAAPDPAARRAAEVVLRSCTAILNDLG